MVTQSKKNVFSQYFKYTTVFVFISGATLYLLQYTLLLIAKVSSKKNEWRDYDVTIDWEAKKWLCYYWPYNVNVNFHLLGFYKIPFFLFKFQTQTKTKQRLSFGNRKFNFLKNKNHQALRESFFCFQACCIIT